MAKALTTGIAAAVLSLGLASCGLGGNSAAPTTTEAPPSTTTTATTATAAATTTSTTIPVTQAGGSRTVLSPIGINVRAKPSRGAKVLGTAAQGAVLTVLGHTTAGGGWFKVRGTTVTGWMSDNSALSAAGHFNSYNSGKFGLLYPASWAVHATKSSTSFRSPVPAGVLVVVSTASSLAKLPQLHPGVGGAAETGSRHVVACGVTSYLDSFTMGKQQVEQILLPLDATHALGLQAYLTRSSQLQIFLDITNSVWFPFPQCVGVPPAKSSPSSTHKA